MSTALQTRPHIYMAGTMKTLRISALLSGPQATQHAARRSFSLTARRKAASNFTMPALSPTMTEGTIASWRVKEGDTYSAGDVLLEIETDKATMDVEAQDDGIVMKILTPDQTKAIQVGARIAVMAEAGDDISSLEMPADESPKQAAPAESKKAEAPAKTSESSPNTSEGKSAKKEENSAQATAGKGQKHKRPLLPSVQHLLHENGISDSAADDIPASGPSGRLLKGDVLAHLGRIDKDYPSKASARLSKLGHLDLSNIQLAAPAERPADAPVTAKQSAPAPPREIDFALPISLAAVLETQKRVEEVLHTSIPLSVFIARASELANEDLPLAKNRKVSSDELFNAVLGLPKSTRTTSRGHFVPQLSTISYADAARQRPAKQADIFDILASPKKGTAKTAPIKRKPTSATGLDHDLFSVTAKPGEEQRAMLYLERLKTALETDPGRLVV